MKKLRVSRLGLAITAMTLTMSGCQSSDERLVQLARENTAQQADQNRDMTRMNGQVAENQRRVVEAVEKTRQEIALLERDVGQQRKQIDAERRSLANERHRESMLAPVVDHVGMLLVASLPLVLCWLLLYGLRQPVSDDEVAEVLFRELSDLPHASPSPERPTQEAGRLEESTTEQETL